MIKKKAASRIRLRIYYDWKWEARLFHFVHIRLLFHLFQSYFFNFHLYYPQK